MRIETERLVIQNFNLSNINFFKDIIEDFNNSQYVIFDKPFPKSDEKIEKLAKRFSCDDLFFEVDKKDTLEMIGYICFHLEEKNYDIGYCFNSKYEHNGYAIESCSAIIKWISDNYEVNKFTAGTALENIKSVNLLKKLGFKMVCVEKLSFNKDKNGNDIIFDGGNFELKVK